MGLNEILSIISTLIGIALGIMNLSEKLSKTTILNKFAPDIKDGLLRWFAVTTFMGFLVTMPYFVQYFSGSIDNGTMVIFAMSPWMSLAITMPLSKDDFHSKESFWKFVIIASIISSIISYFIFSYTYYVAIILVISAIVFFIGIMLLKSDG